MKEQDLKNKFIIAFDTVCDGWQCAKDENDKPAPTLFESEGEAMFELFDDALSMLVNQSKEELAENNIELYQVAEMVEIQIGGNTELMKNYLEENPECNYNDEFIVPAEEFVFGRKTIYNGKSLTITGTKLTDI